MFQNAEAHSIITEAEFLLLRSSNQPIKDVLITALRSYRISTSQFHPELRYQQQGANKDTVLFLVPRRHLLFHIASKY